MQARMKKYPLSASQVQQILESELVGRLATVGEDGYPYITPVHFVLIEGYIYIHGLAVGEKLQNITNNCRVGFEVESMLSIIHDDEKPCDTNTEYKSVIIRGSASMVDDPDIKISVLDAIVKKYTPQHAGTAYPPNMLKMTGVIRVEVQSCTGKYYPRSQSES
ncbi:pyridoxamine 5'-phosphate oxidase family protein [Desulfovibrio sp. OttesenSCG-928-I05]|nr:pyridoxamine 5'-phosphate oxidase family protein [Desulfovibrio sp. OttesenSCG-928-I05]